MGLEYAIEELYATGWTSLDSSRCGHAPDGRVYPCIGRVKDEFAQAGFSLNIRHIELFDCYRAEWTDASGVAVGAVVGQSEAEAAVYALSQLRRQHVPSAA